MTRLTRLLAVIATLVSMPVTVTHADEWGEGIYVESAKGTHYSANPFISPYGTVMQWILWDYDDPKEIKDFRTVSMTILYEYDCRYERSKALEVYLHSGKKSYGKRKSWPPREYANWEYPIPGSTIQLELRQSCSIMAEQLK